MSNFPIDFSQSTELIQAEKLGDVGQQAKQQLAEQGYEVHVGLTSEFAKDIIEMALEPGIKEFCPNDCGSRFKSLDTIHEWLTKGRATFLLLQRNGEVLKLVGYGWAGSGTSSRVPDGETTFAIRIGEAGQGQGLATPFARLIVSGAAALFDAKNMWLETWQSNAGAVHIYHKVGFVDVDSKDDVRPSSSGQVNDTRLYMSLDNGLLNP